MTSILERLQVTFFQHEGIQQKLPTIQQAVQSGKLPVSIAVEELMDLYILVRSPIIKFE